MGLRDTVARAAGQVVAWRQALAVGNEIALGVEAASTAPENCFRGSRVEGTRPRSGGGQGSRFPYAAGRLRIGHPAWPDIPVAPIGTVAIDRVPLPVRGRPPMPRRVRLRYPAQRCHEKGSTRRFPHIYRNEY